MKIVKSEREIDSIEVAKLLDTSPDNVNYLARKGVLPGYKVSKFWRFNRRTIVRWIREHQLAAEA
jgi:excisionase family DNA binding protein